MTDDAHRWTRAGGRKDAAGAVAAASAMTKCGRASRITRCRERLEELFLRVVSRRSSRAFPIERSDAILELGRRAVLVYVAMRSRGGEGLAPVPALQASK